MNVIELPLPDATALLRELEFLVVSLDRIGSASSDEKSRAEEVHRFVVDAQVFRRLSSCRRLLMDAVDRHAVPAAREALEEELESVKPWGAGGV